MTETVTLEALASDIRARLDAVDSTIGERLEGMERSVSDSVSDVKLTQLIRDHLMDLVKDPDFQRKVRFAGGVDDRPVVGMRYARHGLSLADVEYLYDIQRSLVGQRRVKGAGVYEGPSEELTRTFEAISDAQYLPEDQVRTLDRKAIDDLFPRLPLNAFYGKDRGHARRGDYDLTNAYQRAMDTAESGFGSQLVGAQYVHDLWDAPRKLGRIFPLLDSFEMTDPTAYLPVEVDIPELLYVSESTVNPAAAYASRKTGSQRVQVNAAKFVLHQVWSGEMEEDSLVPFVGFLRRQAALSLAHYSDSIVLNGDNTNAATGNINSDDADPDDSRAYLAFDGMRHAYLVDATGQGSNAAGAVTLSGLNGLRGLMIDTTNLHDWGHPTNPDDLVWFSDPFTADKIALLDEYLTMDKYGQGATVFNGEAGRILGHRHISTVAMAKTDTDGKVNAGAGVASNTKGQVAAVNLRGYKVGWRRRIQTETERIAASDQTRLVLSLRVGLGRFTSTGAASGIKSTAGLYNVTVA